MARSTALAGAQLAARQLNCESVFRGVLSYGRGRNNARAAFLGLAARHNLARREFPNAASLRAACEPAPSPSREAAVDIRDGVTLTNPGFISSTGSLVYRGGYIFSNGSPPPINQGFAIKDDTWSQTTTISP